MRNYISFKIDNHQNILNNIVLWSKNFRHHVILNSNNYKELNKSITAYHEYDLIAGFGTHKTIEYKPGINSFEQLKNSTSKTNDWWFGYFSYDLKNEIEELYSNNPDFIEFPEIFFFQPEIVIYQKQNTITFAYLTELYSKKDIEIIFDNILNIKLLNSTRMSLINIQQRFTKKEYEQTVDIIKQHIQLGDIYEMNFCQEFFSKNTRINPYDIYQKLNTISPTPFSCLLRIDANYLLSASPERFLKKTGNKLISQPIKGTIKRGISEIEDQEFYNKLESSEKDRAENIMIVDLVRNDLSKVAEKSSVMVDELCEIYTYKQVHHMISTVSANIRKGIHPVDAIKSAFPMGSMTGAPKIKAMKLIEKYEKTKRGIYSGSVGYIDPEQNFDFNVVIRSILYNDTNKYLSYLVGGAITSLSDAKEEYEECLLKAKAINKVLTNED